MLYDITKEQKTELENARKTNKKKTVDRRLRVLIMRAEGKQSKEIAQATEYHPAYISELVAKYCNNGLSAIIDNHYPGNRRNMSFAEEAAFLETFKAAAEAGQIITVSEIKNAYEKVIGRSLDSSRGQIYRVLERHNWRKLMPRSKHPNKASDEEIESSKKLKRVSKN
jgi:transposase